MVHGPTTTTTTIIVYEQCTVENVKSFNFRHHGAVDVSLNSREIFSFVPMNTAVSFSQGGWIYFLLFVKNDKIKLFEESKKRMSSETIKRRKFKQNFMRNGKGWSCRICPENNNSKWKINSFRFPIFLE